MDIIVKAAKYFTGLNKKTKRQKRTVSVLSAIVIFMTVQALVLPAITLDCGTAMVAPAIEAVYSEGDVDESGMVYDDAEKEAEAVEEDAASEEALTEEDTEKSAASEEAQTEEAVEETPAVNDDSASDTDAEEAAADSSDSTDGTPAEQTEETKLITEDTQLVYEGPDFFVYADFGESAKLPEGVRLEVREITKDSDPTAYQEYCDKALAQMQAKYDENSQLSFARFYDIRFRNEETDVEPGGNVSVRIEYKEAVETENTQKVDTVHFDKENGEKAEVIDCGTKGSVTSVEAVEFESDQFSVYGIVGMKKALPESIPYMFTGSGGGMSNNTAESGLEIDKTATPLNKDYQSTVTLTFPGMQESYSYDVVFVLDKSASAGNETTEIMKEYISAISGNGAMIKTGVVCFYYKAIITKDLSSEEIDYSKININTKEWGIEHELGHKPYGTNLSDGIELGRSMLDDDVSVTDPGHKYLIVISDGDTHVFNNANGDPAVVVDMGDGTRKLAGPTAYVRKYGSWDPPQDWNVYLDEVGKLIAKDGETYYYSEGVHYNNEYTDAEDFIPEGELDQHAVTSDVALYRAYQSYLSAVQDGYMTYSVSVEGTERKYGPSFMDYLNGGKHLSLKDLVDTICYVGSGSTVTDVMGAGTDSKGNEYNFDFISDLDRINVKLNGKTLYKKENKDGSYSFGEKEEFLLKYDKAKDTFTFTIYTNITLMDELQIIYDVQLTDPQTAPGVYEDLDTNTEAVLHPKDSEGNERPDEEFPKPKVSYENPDDDKIIPEDEQPTDQTVPAETHQEESKKVNKDKKPSKIPQTGQLWRPVLVLGCAGIVLLGIGIFRKKKS